MIDARLTATVAKTRGSGVEALRLVWTCVDGTFASDERTFLESIDFPKDERAAKKARLKLGSIGRACGVATPKDGSLTKIVKALTGKIAALDFCDNGEVIYERPAPPKPPRPTLADRAAKVGYNGPRLTSGFASLDGDATRGGFPFAKIIVLGAAPCGGKSMFALAWAHGWSTAGVPVFYLAADGGTEDVMVRLGQRLGFHRDKLECGDDETRKAYARKIAAASLPFDVDDDMTIENACTRLDDMCRERGTDRGVLVVDSIQTAGSERHDDKTRDPRARIDATVQALRAVRERKHLAIVTSEVPRSYYADEKKDPLAAFKESGAIEYAADLAVLLSPDAKANQPDVIVVQVTRKNRLGSGQPTFFVQLKRDRADVIELESKPTRRAAADKSSRTADDVLEAITSLGPGEWSESKIREGVQRVRGREGRADTTATRSALGTLVDRGLIEPRLSSVRGVRPAYALVGRLGAGWVPPSKGGQPTNQATTQPGEKKRKRDRPTPACPEAPGETQ
jgi:KaiC/GvpD/RAD55 family RecA-like ATPase